MSTMCEVVVGLDVHLKKTQVTIMKMNGDIVKRDRVDTTKVDLRRSLECVPKGSKVALESVGFCWPWIDFLEELGHNVLLANPLLLKNIGDLKNDKVDSKRLANLTRMNSLPTCYVPSTELRWLRSLLRHRSFRTRLSSAVKNRSRSEFSKRDIHLDVKLSRLNGRRAACGLDVFEVNQNMELLDVMDRQTKEVEALLKRKYEQAKPVQLLMAIPGIGFLSAVTLYAEICDVGRFSSPDKLGHYAGLVARVRQVGEHLWMGKETKGDAWLKWILVEASWSHVRYCPEGYLAKAFEVACRRKGKGTDAI